ncbi:hypothetical protein GBAR_LOCUS20744 [Geodia barretti]|uniref:Uncharacterized protein n=1 Tax=Geodia barretti TaxID=519541 RepID=A0AA35SXY8_GEOBA|nr:hypothetical protein GBAR_LOCUS20744 [Geodia barretti]
MDSLLESASTYAEVLRNCSSVKVAEWKQEDLERAVNWAEYFKRVNARLQKKPALVRKFDTQLKEISSQTGGRFAQKTLSTEFLGNSLDYLIMSLLENPYLPEGIKELVHQKYATEDHHKHMEKYASTQALFATLTAMHNKLSKHAPSFLKSMSIYLSIYISCVLTLRVS